ncbi:hypothetical protein [Arcicella rosea]|uniref:Uncharacterized protein n=1 Tax=Arcicella rosea TaxID=502909 RepID=A0A841EUH3_9BACT|nr:hypothetical protein [Arcicella rosea]MBB6004288.1 hypothetical protein [Arcicella rosea]
MNDRIKDNPTFKKFEENIKGAKMLKDIVSILSPLNKNSKDKLNIFEVFEKIEIRLKAISQSPDEFNGLFSDLGWIAHESINYELMQHCIDLAKKGNIKSAEEQLAEYYTSENLKLLILQLKTTKEFQKRYDLITLAYKDTIEKRFHSVVPIILMIIDGGVNDIDKNKGFFTDSTDLTAWDSIAAHNTGLTKLREILNRTRKETNEEEIFLPYRNGILHGRDISYSNKYVAGKCWAALIAINDWAKAIQDGNKNKPKEEKTLTFRESIDEIKKIISDYEDHKKKSAETNNCISIWKPRNLKIGVDLAKFGEVEDYENFTPEKDAVKFITNWKKKNYGGIAKQVYCFIEETTLSKEAGRIRKIFENKTLKAYEIKRIIDIAPAISEVYLNVIIEYAQKDYELEIKLRMIYQNEKGDTLVIGQKNGEWKFIDSFFFHKIEYLEES